jgi:phosphoribosylformimino-5-aminoimidazole carboxamide ribotide isomerase
VVGVIDLQGGTAVHAVRGERERYRPLGDPLSLARRYGLEELYVADLDAITGGDVQTAVIAALAREAHVMVDAGVSEPERARALLDIGVDRVVVGTETLTDAGALDRLPTRS